MQTIYTSRLIIRRYLLEDSVPLRAILSDKVTMSFWTEPFTLEQTASWIERGLRSYSDNELGRCAVVLKQNNELIGDCGVLKTEINGETENDLGYIINSKHWGKRYGTEAAGALKTYAFEK
jgi:RimJ/RimL family protein N-acetyltransferase